MTDKYEGHTSCKYSITVGNQPFGVHPTNRITYYRIVKEGDEILTHEEGISDESYANAELFSAAPDLLAENKKLREALEKLQPLVTTLATWGVTGHDVLKIVEQALQETK